MKTIVLASSNPVKLRATLAGFCRMFPTEEFRIESVSVPSGVAAQPASSEETLRGARNRAANAAAGMPQGDYWVGMEGGVEDHGAEMASYAWVVVRSAEQAGKGRSGCFSSCHNVS